LHCGGFQGKGKHSRKASERTAILQGLFDPSVLWLTEVVVPPPSSSVVEVGDDVMDVIMPQGRAETRRKKCDSSWV
jgi:hypothetical protein